MKLPIMLTLLTIVGCATNPADLKPYKVNYYSGKVDTVWATGIKVRTEAYDSEHDKYRHYYQLRGDGGYISDLDSVRSITLLNNFLEKPKKNKW